MEAKYPEINLGEIICAKLKILYFSDEPWIDCYKKVAAKFSLAKKNAKKFYSNDETADILKELIKYSSEDLKELIENESSL